MNEVKSVEIKREEYEPYPYEISDAEFNFGIFDDYVIVESKLHLTVKDGQSGTPIVLNGEEIDLLSLKINGQEIPGPHYLVSKEHLTILRPPKQKQFTVQIKVKIDPYNNDSGTGLYFTKNENSEKINGWTKGMLSTQCESQSFRKITYFPDRPDVLTRFKVRIEADKTKYPDILSNPNLITKGDLPNDRRFATYQDVNPKPCYIFALVAGDFSVVTDTFRTKSRRDIELRYYAEKGKEDMCLHALASLKKSLKWNEDNLGLEYAPNSYYTLVVKRFNFGAMENLGLNVFVENLALANSLTTADINYVRIDGVVYHESAHTWLGDEVTCAMWSEIALKEGLVSLLDQEYSADQTNQVIGRINNIKMLRAGQFPTDGSPLAIPVIPKKWIHPENNYNATTYNKGAEVNRMLMTMLGRKKFFAAINEWVKRYSGKAMWIEDFVSLVQEFTDIDLTQFANTWYHQPGTPQVEISTEYDKKEKTFTVRVKQSCPPSEGFPEKKPFHIPLMTALMDKNGNNLPLTLQNSSEKPVEELLLHVLREEETYVFTGIKEEPFPSFNRNFSAPIKLTDRGNNKEKMAFRMGHDTDPFNMFDAGQILLTGELEKIMATQIAGKEPVIDEQVIKAFGDMLANPNLDNGFLAKAIILPSVAELVERMGIIDYETAHNAREYLKMVLAQEYETEFRMVYKGLNSNAPYSKDWASMCRRGMKNTALKYLVATGKENYQALALSQFEKADNATDKIAAIAAINDIECPEREEALNKLYEDWKHDNLGVYKWLSLNARSFVPGTLERLFEIEKDKNMYDERVPMSVYSLWWNMGFTSNYLLLNDASGSGYRAVADRIIKIGQFNEMVAVRLVTSFQKLDRMDKNRQKLMRAELERVVNELTAKTGKVPSQIYDPISKILKLEK